MSEPITSVLIAEPCQSALRLSRACQRMGLSTVGIELKQVHSPSDSSDEEHGQENPLHADFDQVLTPTRKELASALQGISCDAAIFGFIDTKSDLVRNHLQDSGLRIIGSPTPDHACQSLSEVHEAAAQQQVPTAKLLRSFSGTPDSVAAEVCALENPVLLVSEDRNFWQRSVLFTPEHTEATSLASSLQALCSSDGRCSVHALCAPEELRTLSVPVLVFSEDRIHPCLERETTLNLLTGMRFEESPAPALTFRPNEEEALRDSLFDAAKSVAESGGFRGMVTIHFLMGPDGQFELSHLHYGLSRLDSVTELVTGLDLAEQQLFIALGQEVDDEVFIPKRSGHALGASVFASLRCDETANGTAQGGSEGKEQGDPRATLRFPPAVQGRVRIEYGARRESSFDHWDDVALISTFAPRRFRAIMALDRTLAGTVIGGADTNLPQLRTLLNDRAFQAGHYGTPTNIALFNRLAAV